MKNFEFAFECQSLESGETFMKRFQSFGDADSLAGGIRLICKRAHLLKLHVGACWKGVPSKVVKVDDPTTHDLDRPRPNRAPLRIDIDLTDYTQLEVDKNDLEANDLHWPVLDLAITVTKRALRECFGLDEVLCFYSGRRGVHLWVLDERAWEMNDEARAAVIDFMSCPLDEHGVVKDSFLGRTPLFVEMYQEEILPAFEDMMRNSDMDLFTTAVAIGRFERVLNLTHPEIRHVFRQLKMAGRESAVYKFKWLNDAVERLASKHPSKCGWMRRRVRAGILSLLWPRFDKGASSKLDHLMKAPFSVHSGTTRLAVPLRDDLSNFWPGDVLRVGCTEHEVHNIEGVLRDKLRALGKPKPWANPTALFAPPGADPVVEEVMRRGKKRKLCVVDVEDGNLRLKKREVAHQRFYEVMRARCWVGMPSEEGARDVSSAALRALGSEEAVERWRAFHDAGVGLYGDL